MSDPSTDGRATRTEEPHSTVVLERSDPDPSRASDTYVAWTAAVGAVAALGFAVTLRLGMPLGVYALLLALSCFSLGLSVRRYFFDRFPEVVAAQLRTVPTPDPPAEGAEDGPLVPALPRRNLLTRMLIGALGLFGISLLSLVPSLGPAVGNTLRGTPWQRGRRAVTGDGQPVRPEDIEVGSIASVWPEGSIGVERSAVVVIRLANPPDDPTNQAWVVDETLVAYSKICTHAGCPVALYRERDETLFCPCHQSTFDVRHACRPVFGPAARALPQLPLGVDDQGFLIALADFQELAGPSFG